MNKNLVAFIVLLGMSFAFAADPTDIGERLQSVICGLYNSLMSLLPLIIVMAVVLAGIIYVIGQIFGAETRQKAQGWATNIIIGTIIAILVVLIVPFILGQLAPELGIDQACPKV